MFTAIWTTKAQSESKKTTVMGADQSLKAENTTSMKYIIISKDPIKAIKFVFTLVKN